MDYTSLIKKLCDAIYDNLMEMSDKFKFDRTFDAIVKEVTSSDRCTIEYQGKSYSCAHYTDVNVGDRVKVCAPRNDWNDLYVVVNKTQK